MDRREAGRLGNKAAREKDPQHQRKAGRAGIRALAARYFGGSVDEAMRFLRLRAIQEAVEILAAEKLKAELAAGKETACVELPVLEDYEPESWVERVSSQSRGRSRAG